MVDSGKFRFRPIHDVSFVTYSGDLGIIGTKLNDCLCPNCIKEIAPYIDQLKISINQKGVIGTTDHYIGMLQVMLNTHCGINYIIEEKNEHGEYDILI